jgi:hypothetical protein
MEDHETAGGLAPPGMTDLSPEIGPWSNPTTPRARGEVNGSDIRRATVW